ncbi:aromatic acid exporter family protein [Populibacterium corticicola]|uniref:Aromatic acid exporter family protein n=1 Tax=Populibacterium corticicola TaxID=1812826 RepID=A0ABW5XDC2_9MICO
MPSQSRAAKVVGARARTWVRQGSGRVRRAFVPVLIAAVACGLSHLVAHYVFGHPYPFFAPVAAWACLGFTSERSVRRVAETGLGLTFGIWAGEYFGLLFGHGALQITIAVFLAVMIARFLGSGGALANHSGTQTAVLVGMPAGLMSPLLGGGFGRWTDAVIGTLVSIAVAFVIPSDPRRAIRNSARAGCRVLAETLRLTAVGLRTGQPNDQQIAMNRGRSSEAIFDEWRQTATESLNTATITATARKHRGELARSEAVRVLIDRAMRSIRVIARRAPYTPSSEGTDLVADLLGRLAIAVESMGTDLSTGRSPESTLAMIREIGADAVPGAIGEQDFHAQALILVLRSAIVDLAEACGASEAEARDLLAPL